MIIILGDPHIGKGLNIGKVGVGSSLNSRIIDQLDILDWVLEKAIENDVDRIIITGDVFEDPKPASYLITLFISWINKCAAYNIHVDTIMGNHDMLRTGSYYTSPLDVLREANLENASVYESIDTIYLNNIAFTFLPFRDRKSLGCESNADALKLIKDMLVYELASIPISYIKILVGHLAIEGAIPVGDEIDDMTNELFCPVNMFEGYDYTWMGHVHKPQVLSKSPYVSHIGSMDISNFGETEQKKNIILFDSESNKFGKIEIPTRSLNKISIIVPEDTENTTDFILNEIKNKEFVLDNSITRLDIVLSSSNQKAMDKTVIERYLSEQGVYHVPLVSQRILPNFVKSADKNLDTTIDVPGAIKLWADKKYKFDEKRKAKFIEKAMEIHTSFKEGIK